MTVLVMDTNIVSLVLRDNEIVKRNYRAALTRNDRFILCPVVWYEIKRGLLSRDAKKQLVRFDALVETFDWEDFTREDWQTATVLWNRRRELGQPISDADLLTAAFTLNRSAVLVTQNDKDFVNLGLKIELWTALPSSE